MYNHTRLKPIVRTVEKLTEGRAIDVAIFPDREHVADDENAELVGTLLGGVRSLKPPKKKE